MMLGEIRRHNPTVLIPPWSLNDDITAKSFSPRHLVGEGNFHGGDYSPLYLQDALSALERYLPSNEPDSESDSEYSARDPDAPVDAYSCDHFRMFEFKIRRCPRGRSHDWTECPYAHPGEKARRRDPRKFHYSGTACAEFRKGNCKKGELCEFAHGVFECWLHPARYRTQACKDGINCPRRVCFFAHTPEQLRVLPSQSPRSVISVDSYCESPMRHSMEPKSLFSMISPAEESPANSPPMSPMTQTLSRSLGSGSINEMAASLRNLQLGKVQSLPSAWNMPVGSPRGSILRPGFCSLPITPTQTSNRRSQPPMDFWDTACEEEPAMERVESGRVLRARMFEKLSLENPLEQPGPDQSPDLGWISELVQ